jgi:hypothetical protein
MERLKPIVMRNLLKHVYIIRNKHHQIQIADFQHALTFLNVPATETDIDAVECLLANLIFMGYVKGYISHKQKVLVVSKKMAFPAIRLLAHDMSSS